MDLEVEELLVRQTLECLDIGDQGPDDALYSRSDLSYCRCGHFGFVGGESEPVESICRGVIEHHCLASAHQKGEEMRREVLYTDQ